MRLFQFVRAALLLLFVMGCVAQIPTRADGDLKKLKHVVVIMQENHPFDNYFGALVYAPGSPYHTVSSAAGQMIIPVLTACCVCTTKMVICDASTRIAMTMFRSCPLFTTPGAALLPTSTTPGSALTRK